jgi:hypothetical protein
MTAFECWRTDQLEFVKALTRPIVS